MAELKLRRKYSVFSKEQGKKNFLRCRDCLYILKDDEVSVGKYTKLYCGIANRLCKNISKCPLGCTVEEVLKMNDVC